jgi:hypothetical protein
MSYAKSVFKHAVDAFTWCPPFPLMLSLHAIGMQLDALEAFDPIVDEEIQNCLWSIAGKIPQAYKLSRDAFIAEGQAWSADEKGYGRQPTVPLYDILPVAELHSKYSLILL